MMAVVPARGGCLVAGSEEAIAEAGGVAVIAGDGAAEAAVQLAERASAVSAGEECRELRVLELGESFRPAEWARAIAPHVKAHAVLVLPASPDGRDLAPRLAAALGRPLLAGAVKVTAEGASLAWRQGRQVARFRAEGPFVATLLPGSRSALAASVADGSATGAAGLGVGGGAGVGAAGLAEAGGPLVVQLESLPPARIPDERRTAGEAAAEGDRSDPVVAGGPADPELLQVVAADPAGMDLAEAERIVAAGAGLGGPEQLAALAVVASGLGASLGATRVVTDAGWLAHERQIGTTGVSVRPRCYIAFGISGAAQHVGGLGTPRHIVSVNLDRSCPMMAMADLALVTDAQALVGVLAQRLSEPAVDGDRAGSGLAGNTAGKGRQP